MVVLDEMTDGPSCCNEDHEQMEADNSGNDENHDGRQSMFSRIVSSPDAFFRSQQRSEPDLSDEQKLQICSELFYRSPKLFLARYHKFLLKEDVVLFEEFRDDYEVEFYLKELEACASRQRVVRNRRYNKLRHLLDEGQYFSDYEMRQRDPLLYERLIGRFQTEQESRTALHSDDHQSNTFSDMILKFYDNKKLSDTRRFQAALENQMPHSSSSESECEDDDGLKNSQDAKEIRREEFVRLMHERFLNGEDTGFDYSEVDNDEKYDALDLIEKDEQDKYFDEESDAN